MELHFLGQAAKANLAHGGANGTHISHLGWWDVWKCPLETRVHFPMVTSSLLFVCNLFR